MANDFYTAGSVTPYTLARAEAITAQLKSVEAGFDKFPSLDALNQDRLGFVMDTGVANAYQVEVAYPLAAYVPGMRLAVQTVNPNTGPATIQIGTLGTRAIKRPNGTQLSPNDILSIFDIRYDGAAFILLTNSQSYLAADVNAGAIAAQASAVEAAASAAQAAATALAVDGALLVATDVTKWVAGNYAEGVNVWSPITYQTYRSKNAVTSTVDPSNNPTDWFAINGTGKWLFKTANYTAFAGERVAIDPTGGTFTITLPTGVAVGDFVTIGVGGGDPSVTPVTINGNGKNIVGEATMPFDISFGSLDFAYNGTEWRAL